MELKKFRYCLDIPANVILILFIILTNNINKTLEMLETNTNKLLFKLIKEHKRDEFIKLVQNNPNIDLNIRDESNNYLIQYAVLYNDIEIVKTLLDRGIKIDVHDVDYRSILYIPIKYNYNELLQILLDNEKKSIGISLLDHNDKSGLYPLHYAIAFNNETATKIILGHYDNINQSDNDGNTFLHYSIKFKNLSIFKNLLEKSPDINIQTNTGETSMHWACNYGQYEIAKILYDMGADVNIQDNDSQIIPIMYSIILNDTKLFNLLLPRSDLSIQDADGNNSLHYSVAEDNSDITNLIISKMENFNIGNLEGKLPLHLYLYKNRNESLGIPINLKSFISKTNINLQDNNGVSCFYLIVRFGLWESLKEILEKHKINAFQKNIRGNYIYDLVNEEKKPSFLDILTESYFNQLRTKKSQWEEEIDKICTQPLTFNKYKNLKSKNNVLPDLDDSKIKKSKDVCKDVIKQIILDKKQSFPKKHKFYCIDFENEQNVSFITYTGDIIDIMFGLIFLKRRYKKDIVTTLSTNFNVNKDLKRYYEKNEDREIYSKEFMNIEVIWVDQNIFYPTILDQNIEQFKKSKARFLIIPLGIELSIGSHANILIYDKKINEMERFEPNGGSYPFSFNYNPKLLDQILNDKFSSIFKNLKYVKPSDYIPKIGFQYLESYSKRTHKIGDPDGFCAAWCSWYADLRIKYPDMERSKLIHKTIRRVRELGIKFKNLIRNFSKKIIDIRDEYLKKVNLDINDWKNVNYTEEQISKFIIILQNHIEELEQ